MDTYLRGLNLDALRAARERADELIKVREAEARLGVWVVEGHLLTLRRFAEADYLKAAEAVLEEARTLAQIEPKPFRRTLSLSYKLVPASECTGLDA
ncbi:MAG: hypothetical protein JSR28_17035 [Proteobacteria bacterium]|nr:hypothetical protein [Pseudomonadota bacterium]